MNEKKEPLALQVDVQMGIISLYLPTLLMEALLHQARYENPHDDGGTSVYVGLDSAQEARDLGNRFLELANRIDVAQQRPSFGENIAEGLTLFLQALQDAPEHEGEDPGLPGRHDDDTPMPADWNPRKLLGIAPAIMRAINVQRRQRRTPRR